MAAGQNHGLALLADGTVTAWGNNNEGQTSVPAGLADVAGIDAGDAFSLAMRRDGTVVAWGYNYFGQTNVPAGLSNVMAVAGAQLCSMAIIGVGAPSLAPMPARIETSLGNPVFLRVQPVGEWPISCQWEKDGAPLANETNPVLKLTAASSDQAGAYRCVAANARGVTTGGVVQVLFKPSIALDVLPPSKIAVKSFAARWKWADGGSPEGQLSVASDAAFTSHVAGYQDRYVVNSTECTVTNLISGRDYHYRVRHLMPDGGVGPWSSSMKVRTGKGLPVFTRLLSDVSVSKGISQTFAISNIVAGTGTLRVKSSNTNAVKAAVSAGELTLQYLWKAANTAKVTMTLKHPATGYTVSCGAVLTQAAGSVAKTGQSALFTTGTRVAQEITLQNKTGGMVYGLRVRVKGLDNPAWLINRTGLDPVTKAPIIEIPCVLPASSQTVVRLIYNTAYKAQVTAGRPVKYAAWAIVTPVHAAKPVSGEMAITKKELCDGLWLLGLPANRNRLYAIYHSDDEGATWTLDLPIIRSTANSLMWLDLDEGSPPSRLYRVVDVGM